jgi:hypothetical protein
MIRPTSGQCVDLRNPFDGACRPVQVAVSPDAEAWRLDVLELLSRA